jgi:hypothetical protein
MQYATGKTWMRTIMKTNMEQLKERLCGRRYLFPLGQVVLTPNAAAKLRPSDVVNALCRHAQGDWGDVDEEDRIFNDIALEEDAPLHSAYHVTTGDDVLVITAPDRSVTTVLLFEDY